MSKSAAAKKVNNIKKAPAKSQKSTVKAKTPLKVVKSNSKVTAAKKPAKKVVLKEVKKAPLKAAAKPVKKAVAKTSQKSAPAKAVAKAPVKTQAKAPAKSTQNMVAKPIHVQNLKAVAPARPVQLVSSKAAETAQVARPINVANGFNKMARPNGFVKKSYRTVDPKQSNIEFKIGSYVVYPTHGVGQIIEEETQDIGGIKLKMFVISFVKDKMTLRVPMHRAHAAGLRHISSNAEIKKMYDTLKAKAKTSRGMWSRRAQEYESKINSGNVLLIAEVVRDLHQNVDQAERSYSERMIYESAFNRLAGELAASEKTEYKFAGDKLLKLLRAKKAA